jgi:dephospho-CoA kinase
LKLYAIVGMAGAGKTEAARFFEENSCTVVRFGDITDDEIIKRGLVINEENERTVRESLRKEYGMEAYAVLNQPKIDQALKYSSVVIDGLYSWEEYKSLKDCYGDQLAVLAVLTSPATRHHRLSSRKVRPLTSNEAFSRDRSEIENLNKGGPIAMADYNIVNEGSLEDLARQVREILHRQEELN